MPPFVSRKREASTPPPTPPLPIKKQKQKQQPQRTQGSSVDEKKNFLESLAASDDSSLSDADSDEFEDVLHSNGTAAAHSDDEDMEWEDAIVERKDPSASRSQLVAESSNHAAAKEDLELTLGGNEEQAALKDVKKKGPSKIERKIRISTHCVHVQSLMYHNALRNMWISDKQVQRMLLAQLPPQIKEVVDQWRRDCGITLQVDEDAQHVSPKKGKGREKAKPGKTSKRQTQRDWGGDAEHQGSGQANMSRADPTLRMLKYLARYWNKAFQVTAPGIRKHGYKSNKVLKEQVNSFNKGQHDHELHGERVPSLQTFRDCAKRREGSRDVGAQLFTALCRALNLESRLVANLQPLGFGWNKSEEASAKKAKTTVELKEESSSSDDISSDDAQEEVSSKAMASRSNKPTSIVKMAAESAKKKLGGGTRELPMQVDDSSDLSEAPSESSDSVVDITPKTKRRIVKRYDRDLAFPNYWTEVVSPISHKVYPVDSMLLLAAPATNDEHLSLFEPRGARADKAKQMIAYVIGHSPDGTAKDVTTRYLKRHMWPGKTKSVRLPAEKIPIYDRKGKIKKYEEYDWFKTVMSSYVRPVHLRTQVDDIEEATDLKQAKLEKKVVKDGEESLQYYKQSADYVLERFLRREEALLPTAKPVKQFLNGKGDKAKEEPVFRRIDVVACKTEESWHKEGRKPILDAEPLKHVPIRAVTITRKREIEDMARRNNGIKPMQGLYSKRQTEYIIPPPIQNGVIPKNAYGNIDCFVPSMVPQGAVHVPLRSTARVCKKLGIDYAEAVVGFEFGNKMAVPVIRGVVVAEENRTLLIDTWNEEEQARQVREDEKRLKLVLSTWRKFLMGARILDRIRAEIGDDPVAFEKESVNPFMRTDLRDDEPEEELEGGFLRDDEEKEDIGGGELEIIDHEKASAIMPDDDVQLGGGFMTDTPEETSDKVFDPSVMSESLSDMSSVEAEEDTAAPSKSVKKPLPKKTKQPASKTAAKRRSGRAIKVKSKYFEDSSDVEEDVDNENSATSETDEVPQKSVKSGSKQTTPRSQDKKVKIEESQTTPPETDRKKNKRSTRVKK